MTHKKKIFIPMAIVIALLFIVSSFYVYWSFHPQIVIIRTFLDSSVRFDEEYHYERIMTIISCRSDIPIAKHINDALNDLSDWNNKVNTDLYENYVAPLYITVSGEVKDGKTTFWYEGYVTTQDGETIDYREEKTFDYVFVPNDELFSSEQTSG